MNNNMYEELVELGIFDSKMLSEEEYNECIKNNNDESFIYLKGHHDGGNEEYSKWYKQIDTKGQSMDEVKLQLEIIQTRHIKTIKNILIIFATLIVISIIIAFIIGFSSMPKSI